MEVIQLQRSEFDKLFQKIEAIENRMRTIGIIEKPLTTKEAAKFLNLHENTIYLRMKSGTIPFHRSDSTYYFFPSELVASIKKQKSK